MPTAVEIKKALKDAGLEIYRTRAEVVFLADRVRENLLMDAGSFVRGVAGAPGATSEPGGLRVGFVVRAQLTDFPGAEQDFLFERARAVAASAVERGYAEVSSEVRPVLDPEDSARTLDTWCEVTFEREVADLAAAAVEARFAVGLEKVAPQEGRPKRSTIEPPRGA